MSSPFLTSFRFSSSNKNLNAYAQNCYRRKRLSRFAGWLRKKLHRCYGADDWHGNMAAILSEPPWLKAVWRWCGVPFIGFDMIRTPYISSFYTKEVRKVDGVWYCDTTYTPPPFLDLRQIIMENSLRDMRAPDDHRFLTMLREQVSVSCGVPKHLMNQA